MNWLDKLERKFGRYHFSNVSRYMILANLIGYVLYYVYQFTGTNVIQWLQFYPPYIFKGQIWRLVTWIFVPSSSFSFWELLFIVCLLMLGDNLERGLGSFRMLVYFAGGVLISDIGGILIYLIFGIPLASLNTYYILFSLYLMLGLFIPDAEVRLYFVLPIKMKYMIIFYAVMFAVNLWESFSYGFAYGIYACSGMILAIINLLIFVMSCKRRISFRQAVRQRAKQREFRRQSSQVYPGPGRTGSNSSYAPPKQGYLHKCCICGRTDVSNPELTFRFCSKCTGGKEYCNDHLFTHEHN